MTPSFKSPLLTTTMALALTGCGSPNSSPAPNPPIPAAYLMRGVVELHFERLRVDLQDPAPDEDTWKNVGMSATLLREASYQLMRSAPNQDEAWTIGASGMLRKGSEGILEAAAQADQEAARVAFSQLTEACSTCHRECPADDWTFEDGEG